MIVLDASVVIDALEADSHARQLLRTEVLHAPHLIDAEVLQTLARRQRQGIIAPADGEQHLAVWSAFELERHAARADMGRAWELRHNLSGYDALYVALAERLQCPLATADARLARAPGVRCEVAFVGG